MGIPFQSEFKIRWSWGQEGKKKSKELELALKGLLRNGQGIYANYKGKRHRAVVYSTGRIRFDGQIYDTPSGAAMAIVERRTCNGWRFWKYKNKKGELVPLSSLRK